MAKRKGSDAAWSAELKRAAKPERGSAMTGTLFAAVPQTDLENLKDLARRLSRERAGRVTISQLAGEAVRDLLTKYRKRGR